MGKEKKFINVGIIDVFDNRSKQSLKDYFKGLNGNDRRNLTDILCSLRDAGIQGVLIGGSSTLGKGYSDIDIGIMSRGNKYVDSIAKLGANIREIKIKEGEEDTYLGIDEKYLAKAFVDYKGSNFDITVYERVPLERSFFRTEFW